MKFLKPHALAAVLMATGVSFAITAPIARSAPGDTVADVMTAGRNGYEAIRINTKVDAKAVATQEAAKVMQMLSSDSTYAASMLKATNAGNTTAVISLIKKYAPLSTISGVKYADWKLTFSGTYKGYKITVCASNKAECDGNKATVAVS